MKESLPDATARLARFLAQSRGGAAIGGIAIIGRVKARTTDDLDVIVAATADEIPPLLAAAKGCGYTYDEGHVRDFVEMGLMRLRSPHGPDGYGLDVILADSSFLQEVVRRATPVSLGGVVIPVATLEDLVLLKLDANRPVDIDDILSIKDAFGATLDFTYLDSWADQLRIRDRLDLYFDRSAR